MRKLKEQIKKQLNNSIIHSERHENKELQDKAENVQKNNEAAGKILNFEYVKRRKNRNILWLA